MIEKFPLLKTPAKAFKLVLQNLEIIDIISLSLTSIKTRRYLQPVKNLVKTLRVQIVSENFYFTAWPVDRRITTSFYIRELGTSGLSFTTFECPNQRFGDFPTVNLKLWLQNFLRIFDPPRISELTICGRGEFALSLMDLFQGFKIGKLRTDDLDVVRQLGKHADYLNWICLGDHPSQESLISNMLRFDAGDAFASKITIDDIMVSNIRTICLYVMYFSLKEYNRFLKCWIKGSTSNLEYLIVQRSDFFEQFYGVTIDEDNFEERLFKGIPYQKFETSGPHHFVKVQRNVTLSDGYEIRRKNGRRALIEFERGSFQFVVPRD